MRKFRLTRNAGLHAGQRSWFFVRYDYTCICIGWRPFLKFSSSFMIAGLVFKNFSTSGLPLNIATACSAAVRNCFHFALGEIFVPIVASTRFFSDLIVIPELTFRYTLPVRTRLPKEARFPILPTKRTSFFMIFCFWWVCNITILSCLSIELGL